MSKKVIKTKDVDGQDLTLIVRSPSANDLQKAQMESNKVFAGALESGSILRSQLRESLRKRNLWTEDMDEQLRALSDDIFEKEKILRKGGIKRSEAKKICIEISDLRFRQASLLYNERQHDMFTAEAQAENAKFDYLVSVAVFDEEGNRFFKSLDDYKARATETAAAAAASALAELVNNYDPDWEKKLPENEFLLKHGFVNEKLQYVNKEGQLVDSEGRRVNDKGFLINEAGEPINRDGERIGEDGMPIVEFQPLIDDEVETTVEQPKDKVEVTEEVAPVT